MKREQIKERGRKYLRENTRCRTDDLHYYPPSYNELLDWMADFYLSQPQQDNLVEALRKIAYAEWWDGEELGERVEMLQDIASKALTEAKEGGDDMLHCGCGWYGEVRYLNNDGCPKCGGQGIEY